MWGGGWGGGYGEVVPDASSGFYRCNVGRNYRFSWGGQLFIGPCGSFSEWGTNGVIDFVWRIRHFIGLILGILTKGGIRKL